MTRADPTEGTHQVIEERFLQVPLVALRLDPQNPRLPRDQDWSTASEEQILRELYSRYNLIELAYSIADKGFTPRHAEALLVIADPDATEKYIVVEGNRRLATLQLLTNKSCRVQVHAKELWEALANKAASKNLDSVPVVVHQDRQSLSDYLGFRHITGPTPWRPEAKARFIARLLSARETIGEVARRIGSNHRTVRRFAEAHAVYSQALENDLPMNQVEAAFGVFYNALDQPGVRTFLGLGKQSEIQELPESPLHTERLENLRQLIDLLYGDEARKLKKVISESRELKILGEVLEDDRGRRSLFVDRDLKRAWRIIGGGRTELLALLEGAFSRLAEANGQATEYRDDEAVLSEVRRVCGLTDDMFKRFGLDQD